MNKLRSDSAFCRLTPEQVDVLEGWLFEERLGYPKVLEKLKAEFGLETSLTGLGRFYKRLDMERSRASLVDAVEMSGLAVEMLRGGTLKPGMLALANKCAFELMRQSPPPIRKVTALLRAITSAEANAMKQTVFEREEQERREKEREREARESWRMTPEDYEEERREQEEAERAEEDSHLSPALSPKGGEGEELGQLAVHGVDAGSSASGNPEPKDEKGEDEAHSPVTKDAGGAWQPRVVGEGRDAENGEAEAEENRLTPLNAA